MVIAGSTAEERREFMHRRHARARPSSGSGEGRKRQQAVCAEGAGMPASQAALAPSRAVPRRLRAGR